MLKRNAFVFLCITAIFIVALFFRLYGFFVNHPFWVDEFYTAAQANVLLKYGLSVFFNPALYFEYHNITPHFLVALFFKLLGQSEWAARLPFVIIGSLIPVATFIVSYKLFNLATALSAALLASFSYLEIAWSRQARGYVIQQLLVLLTLLFYLRSIKKGKIPITDWFILSVLFVLGIITHSTFFILIGAIFLHFVWFNRKEIHRLTKNSFLFIILGVVLLVAYFTGFFKVLFFFLNLNLFGANNLWYYHSFLWREYGLITFLSIIGFALGFLEKRKEFSLIILYTSAFLAFLSFIFKPYVSRYLLPVFPLFLIGASYGVSSLSSMVVEKFRLKPKLLFSTLIPLVITLFIIINGDKFVFKPKSFYSVNHDFREAALIDYKQIYDRIKKENEQSEEKAAVIETLPDRAEWYLGYGYKPLFLFRGGDIEGYTHGITRKTTYTVNKKGEKLVTATGPILVSEVSDLMRIQKHYPRGFLFIDGAALPQDVIGYAQNYLKKEMYVDHYPLDDNPYSIWPATLYSWGIEEQ
ncbi:glycosyltransferase family 39 protein [Candidatus Roizmanbacteria bacterium]|nr:glycosyltransferase family 39 protein [Candidatus Roizmanbacteria bacterium]